MSGNATDLDRRIAKALKRRGIIATPALVQEIVTEVTEWVAQKTT